MKLRFLGASALLAAAASSGGCSSETAREATGRSHGAIQRGADDATHTFAVGVCGVGTGPADCPVTCSGALIAPNLVVTARHCVESTNARVDCASARFTTRMADAAHYWITTDASMHQPTAGWHRAAEIVTPAAPEVCGNDIALLVLEDVIPAAEATPAAPAVRYPLTNHTLYRFATTVIGYGVTAPPPASGPAPTPDTAGYRRRKTDVPLVCIPDDPNPSADCCHVDARTAGVVAENEFEAGDGTCEGDSGAGAFDPASVEDGKAVAIGVLSRGGVDDTGLNCVGSIYTRLDRWRDLLVQSGEAAATRGGYPAPSWTAAPPPGTEGCFTPPRGSSALLACAAPVDAGDDCPDGPLCRARICAGITPPSGTGAAASPASGGCAAGARGGPFAPATGGYALAATLVVVLSRHRRPRLRRRTRGARR